MAVYGISKKSWAGIAKQAAQGTYAAPTEALYLNGAPSVEPNNEMVYDDAPTGYYHRTTGFANSQWVEGDIPLSLRDNDMQVIADIVLDHSGDCDQIPFFSYTEGIGNQLYKKVTDCKVKTANFSFDRTRGYPAEVSVGLLGITYDMSGTTITFPGAVADLPYSRADIAISVDGTDYSAIVNNVNFRLDWNCPQPQDLSGFSTLDIATVLNTEMRVDGDMEFKLRDDSAAYLATLAAGDDIEIEVVMTQGTSVWTLAAGTCKIEAPKVSPSADKTSLETARLTFVCLGGTGTASDPISLTNT